MIQLGAVEPLGESYLRTPFVTLWGKRGFWLAILFVGGPKAPVTTGHLIPVDGGLVEAYLR